MDWARVRWGPESAAYDLRKLPNLSAKSSRKFVSRDATVSREHHLLNLAGYKSVKFKRDSVTACSDEL